VSDIFREKVYSTVRKIPKGKVMTYKEVAESIGNPKSYRAVGNALNKNRDKSVPCHRVIRSDGKIGGYAWGNAQKKQLLKEEGYL
jgi:O-6-methylguanine DNA methyltransferase